MFPGQQIQHIYPSRSYGRQIVRIWRARTIFIVELGPLLYSTKGRKLVLIEAETLSFFLETIKKILHLSTNTFPNHSNE
ncbi:hypothetical protein JAB4_037680 [Janthinobacterium sp. HH102]|nr:hypothetical protein JAB4_037680 [Janthinobacterium sp. HH102]